MVAIVTGAGLGLERSSGFVLGSNGQLGNSTFGQYGENVTVNASTGNLFIDRTDEILIGQGPDSTLARSYNSLGSSTDDNGDNWRLSAQKSVSGLTGTVNRTGSTVTRTDWDGSQTVYTYSSSAGAYVSQQSGGAYDTLTFASNTWTWTDGSTRTVEKYDSTNGGRITSTKDSSGNALTYSYTGNLLTRVTTQDGEHTDLTWSGNNLTQISTTLTNGTVSTSTRYTYDSSNRLSTVTTDLTPGDNSVADGNAVTTTYTYDGTSDRVTSISQTGGASLVIGYTLVGSTYRVSSLTQTLAAGVTSTTTLSYNNSTNTTTVTDAQGQVTQLVYDSNDQLTQMTLAPAQSGATSQVTNYTYDSKGNVLTATDALGNVTTYQYDSRGNLTLTRDAAGNTVTRSYNSDNQMLTETTYAVPDPDGSGSGQPSQPSTTRYVYDTKDRLSFVIDPLGYVTEYDYNSVGQQVSIIVYRNDPVDLSGMAPTDTISYTDMTNGAAELDDKDTVERTDMTYDFRGNISTVTTYSATATNGTALTTQPYTVVTYVYDQHGNLLSRQTSGVANSQVYSYDGLGRVAGSTDLNGGTTSVSFTAGANTSVVTLASGLVTTSVYNLAGELVSTTQSGSGIASGTTSYAYDNLGRLRMVTDALGNKTYYLYDSVGRKIADIAADGSITEYRYNADNQLVATINHATTLSGAALASLVDSNGNPTNVTLASILPAASSADIWNWNIYDNAGRLIENIDGDGGVTTFTYDGMSNKTATTSYANVLSAATLSGFKTTAPTSLQLPTANSAHDDTTRYFYDADSQLIGTLNADGYLSEIDYDGAGQVVETVTYATATTASLRVSGSLSALEDSAGSTANDLYMDYAYDGEGHLQYSMDNLLRPTKYVYDATGNLIQTIVYAASIATPDEYTTSDIVAGIVALANSPNPVTRVSWSVYDSAGQVAYSIDAMGDVVSYSYDTSGNVIKQTAYATQRVTTSDPSLATMNSWAAGQASDTDNRISRMVYNTAGELAYEVDAQGYVTEHRYDVDGNLTLDIRYADSYAVSDGATAASMATLIGAVPSTAVQTGYSYDHDGRLVDSYDGMGVHTHLVYNALGQVTDKTVAYGLPDAATCHYVYDSAGRLLSQTEAYGTAASTTTSYTYDGLGNVLTAVDGRGNTTSYTYDALGQVLTITTPIGVSTSAVTTNVYNAFGNVVKTTDALGNSSYFYYDALDRLDLEVDAGGYATATTYGMGSEIASVIHYATAVSGTITAANPPTITHKAADETTQFTRDKLGRVTQEIDAQGGTQSYTLDAFGDQTKVTNQLGGTTNNVFDHRGLLISETLPSSSAILDANGHAVAVTNTYSYDARGNRIQMVEAKGMSEARTTNYAYDNDNRLIRTSGDAITVVGSDLQTTSSVVPTTTLSYDDHGNVIESQDATGARTFFYYDALNRKVAEVNAMGVLSSWSYDQNGNVTAQRVYDTRVSLPTSAGGNPPSQGAGSYRETDYTYDDANQLLTTTVSGVLTGVYGTSGYAVATVSATITNAYDNDGNLVSQTDADGHTVFYYYDKLDRKIAEVDQDNYLTTYALDADGNVLTETEYAAALSASPTVGSVPTPPASSQNDRITTFTYDKNGLRLSETRQNVAAWNVNTGNGALTAAASTASTITYTYNGLGEVLTKTEVNGDTTSYAYDLSGRQTSVTDAAYTDYTGASVQNQSVEYYDGLNDLIRTVSNGLRTTTSTYGAGGLLTSMTDADGFTTNYQYDADGRVVKQSYVRVLADNTNVTEAKATSYDALGRVTAQSIATLNGSSWSFGDQTQTQYNAYGEVVATGVNGLNQETSSYDNAGRVVRTTSGDGTVKLYLYDANGNQTLEITSDGNALPPGYSWTTLSQSQAIALLTNNGAGAIGTVAVPGIVVTITAYDNRGQVLQTIQPLRQLSASVTTSVTQQHAYDAFGDVVQDTDANGNVTNYVYNTLGKIVQQISPTVNSTAENGAVTAIRPTQTNYYDLSGRLIGVRDANGNLNTRVLLAGTGYGTDTALVVKEFHADSGIVTNGYDVFGDLRQTTNEDGDVESFTYDAMDRLVADTHPTVKANTPGNNTGSDITLVDYYAYDGLGQRIQHWNSEYGASNKEQTFYDAQGRVVKSVDMAQHATKYSYQWSSSITTNGLGTFGGWIKTTTNSAGLTSTENIDYFGRTVSKTDFGGHGYAYTFDQAGRTIGLTNSAGENQAYTYYNTGNLEFIDNYIGVGTPTTTTTTTTIIEPGNTWVPGTPAQTDSSGHVIVAATPGYYENVTTATTETDSQGVYVPGDTGWTDTSGVVHGATSGHYTTTVTDTTTETIVVTTQTTQNTTTTTTTPSERTAYAYDAAGNRTHESYSEDFIGTQTIGATITTNVDTQTLITTAVTADSVTTTTVSGTEVDTVNSTHLTVDPALVAGDTWVPPVTDSHGNVTPGYYEQLETGYNAVSVTDYAQVNTTGDTWVPAVTDSHGNVISGGYYEQLVSTTTSQSVTDYAQVNTTGDTWVPASGNTPGYYEVLVSTTTPESVTDYAQVNTTGDTWVPPVTDSHGNVITAGYYEQQVTTYTPESVTDYAQVNTTGDTWVPPVTDSHGNVITAGYYEQQVTTYTPESVTDYAQVNTTGDTWFPASGGTPGYYAYLVSGTTPEQVTDYALVDTTGDTWVPGTPAQTDSHGNVIVAATAGYYEKQVTTYTAEIWVPQVTNSFGQVVGGGFYVAAPPGTPSNEIVEVPTTSWQVVQPTTHTVQVPYSYWQEVAPTTHTVQVPSTSWQVVQPTTHTVQVPSTSWQVVAPTTHTVNVTTQSWQVVAPTTHTVQVTSQSWQEVYPTTHTVEQPYTYEAVVDPSTYMVETPYTYTVSTPWSYVEHGASPSTTTTTSSTNAVSTSSTPQSSTTSSGLVGSISYENETIAYDAMNRMISISDTGFNNTAPITIALQYDANGNVRERDTTYYALNADGSVASAASTEDDWYKYDTMNRFVTTKGTFVGTRGSGSIVRGMAGTDLSYDLAGNRVSASSTEFYSGSSYTDSFGNVHTVTAGGYQEQTENYVYTADGMLAQVSLAYGGLTSNPGAIPHSSGAGTLLASYAYDAMGRTTHYNEYGTGGVVYSRTASYDADSNVTADSVTTVRSDGTYVANTTYDYDLLSSDGAYDGAYAGVLTHSHTTNTRNGTAAPTSDTVNSYSWWDSAKILNTALKPDVTQGTVNNSSYVYDAAGNLTDVRIQDGQPRMIELVNNAQGEVIKRDVVYDSGITAPHELHYYVNGIAVGDVSNDGPGVSDTDYVTSVAEQTFTPGYGAFQEGSELSNSYADFDQSYDAINGFDTASAPQTYTVAQGDTLQNIAQQLWGDASLWYLIADANGLSSSSVLTAGMSLSIPDKVTNFHNNSSTYQVYDPNAAVGDTSPDKQAKPTPPPVMPPAHKGGGCGVFGEIIEVVVAVVASYFTFGAALAVEGATSVAAASLGELALAGAAAGAVGSVAAQGFGLATGMQSSFNWAGVAEGAIGGAIGGALASVGGGLSGSGILPTVERGVIGNVATQGIEVATGLEKSFDWTGVAASAVGAGAGWEAGSLIGYDPTQPVTNINNDLLGGVSGMAGAIANAATRSAINGSDFGSNIIAALPDTIGQTIGNAIAGEIQQAQQEDALNSAFSKAAGDPSVQSAVQNLSDSDSSVQGALQEAGYDPNKPLTPQQLMAVLNANTSGLSAQDTISTIKGNIGGFIDQAKQYAMATGNSDAIGVALAENSALVATYSAIGLAMPNFQWTYVGAFVAPQVRDQLLDIYDRSRAVDFASSILPGGGAVGITGDALADHLINTIIQGQVGVVEDIGSLALAYKDVGAGILNALPTDSTAYKGFQMQIEADADMAKGNYAGGALAGEQAAVQFGIREQTGLQNMWNDPILSAAAKGMQALGLVDTTIHTPIGDIGAPAGANDVTNLQDRIAIAKNAFGYMYQHLYMGNNGANWSKVIGTLGTHMNPNSLPQRPKVFGINI